MSEERVTDARAENVGARPRRDALAWACHVAHLAVMIWIVAGWLAPVRLVLGLYLAFLPVVVLQWQFNESTCVLNNLEALVRTGRWRNPANPEEGAWFLTVVEDTLGLHPSPAQLDAFVYVAMAGLWGLGLTHLLHVWTP
jgi:hypothetical protein